MPPTPVDKRIDRLQSTLLTTGLQTRDNPTFQVLTQLIGVVKDIQNEFDSIIIPTPSPSGGGSSVVNNFAASLIGLENNLGDDNSSPSAYIPGPVGPRGYTGANGIPGIDGLDGSDNSDISILPNGGSSRVTPGGLTGYVQFNGGGYFAGDSNLFWDNTNKRLGVGTSSPFVGLDIESSLGGATAGKFGNLLPVYILYNYPALGFNVYYDGSNYKFGKGSSSSFAGLLTFRADSGRMGFFTSDSGNFGATATLTERLSISASGTVGIGTTNPLAALHIKAGTASANNAPIKLTSGVSLTSPEAGAIEFTTDDLFFTITTGPARKGIILNNGANLTSGKIPVATTNGRLIDSTASLLTAGGIANVVASTFERAETGTDANVLTYTTGAADEYLVVMVSADVSALTGTSIVITVTWKDSNNATATSSITLSGVADGTINVPINVKTATSVVVSTVFVGVSTAYIISAFITRLK